MSDPINDPITTAVDLFTQTKAGLDRLIAEHDLADSLDLGTDHVTLTRAITLGQVTGFFSGAVSTLTGVAPLPDLPFDDAELTEFDIHRADDDAKLPLRGDIALDFKGTASWSPAPGLEIALDTVAVGYWGGDWSGSVAGHVTIKGVRVRASLDWPSLTVEGWLDPETPIDLTAFLREHGLAPSDGPEAKITRLALTAAPKAKHFQLVAAAEHLIRFGPVDLEQVDLVLDYHGGMDASFTGQVHCDLTIGDIAFDLTGEKTETGWQAEAVADATMPLDDLVKAATRKIGGTERALSDFGVPPELAGSDITGQISLTLDTAERHAVLAAEISVSDGKGTLAFAIDIAPEGLTVHGTLTIDDLRFAVDFTKQDDMKILAASFVAEQGVTMTLSRLVDLGRLTGGAAGPAINAGIEVTLKDVLLAMASDGDGPRFLAAANVDGGIDLSGFGDLPVVGDMLPADLSLKLGLAPVLVNQPWGDDVRDGLADLVGDDGPSIPDDLSGPALGVSISLPGLNQPMDLGLSLDDPATADDVSVSAPPAAPDAPDPVKWLDINKGLGPVSLERLGLGLDRSDPDDPVIRVLLDASLALGPLELSLLGFGAHYGLSSKEFGVELSGMGVSFYKPPLEIAGGFAEIDGDYLGKAKLSLKQISMAVSGGFKMIDGTPSLFIYGVLNTPLGGPPFFFVQGVAAGFGLNRDLITPALSDVSTFPFVADAMSAASGKAVKRQSIGEELRALAKYVRPQLGQYFLAAGIKFSSFKLLESFILLILSVGREFKIDIIGISTFQNPPIVPPGFPAMVRIELNMLASIRPLEGSVLVQAELSPDSYVYSPVVKLSGGFAFASWFGGPHAGDFVISAGGYHPDFKRPAHYPKVSRIGLTFQVPGVDVFIKGTAYFALTPSMLMAGGGLHAHASIGKVSADFRLNADFLVAWEPYHYEARLRISVNASWWIFSTTASAQLRIWGPPFAGHARVTWTVISFDVSFGHSAPSASPISWQKFHQSFLPHTESGAVDLKPSVAVTGGQIGELHQGGKTLILADPSALEITVDSTVPLSEINGKPGKAVVTVKDKPQIVDLGCGPMGVKKITASSLTAGFKRAHAEFDVVTAPKTFPTAMWGQKVKPAVNDPTTLKADGVVTLTLREATQPKGRVETKRGPHLYHAVRGTSVAGAEPLHLAKTATQPATAPKAADALAPADGARSAKRRAGVLRGLGLNPDTMTVREEAASALRVAPIVVAIRRR